MGHFFSPVAPQGGTIPLIPEDFVRPGLSLGQLLAIVRAYQIAIGAIIVAVLVVTALLVTFLPRTWTATATLMVSYEVNDPLNGEDFPVGLLGSYMATQIELMQNPEVLLPVVDRLNLTKNESYTAGYGGRGSTLREWAAGRLSRNLSIFQGPFDSHLIHVTYSASDAAEAADVANAVADVYMEQDRLRAAGPATARATRYAEQLEQLKNKVSRAQDEVTAFHQRNALIDAGVRTDVDIDVLANLEQQLMQARNTRRGAEARASGDQSVGALVLASPLIQGLKAQLAGQQARLAELELNVQPQYRPILDLQSQIGATRAALAAETASYSSSAASELTAARQLERKLQGAVDAQHGQVLAVGRLHDEGAKYQLELESTQAVYKRALDGYDRIMFASSGRYTNVNFVSRARPPVKATQPKVLMDLLLGLVAAILLGLLGPLGYELFHRRVRCRDDIERNFGVPLLAEFGALPNGAP